MEQPKRHSVSSTGFRLSIRIVVFGALGALGLLAVGKFGWEASRARDAYARTVDQREFDKGANQFITGLFEVLMERLFTNNGLQGANPADAAVYAEIEKRRTVVKDNFEPGVAALRSRDFPNKQALMQELNSAIEKANDYRKQADAALKLPRDQRNENLVKTFIPTITTSVNASLNVWFSALYATAKTDPALARLASIKELGWRMRDMAGSERSIIASAIASGAAIPAEGVTNATAFRARVFVLRDQLRNLTLDPDTDPAIIAAMKNAEQKYYKDFLNLADEMRKISASGGQYPMTASQWVDTSTPQLGSLLEIMYAAGKASEAYTAQLSSSAFRDMLTELGFLLLCVLVVCAAIGTIIFQVTRPLTALSGAMRELADGNFDVVLPGLGRRNEVGDMAAAVEMFKVRATEKSKLETEAKQAEEASSSAQRRKDRHKLADDFQATAGAIIEIVSSTSTQLEAAANRLTKTAETTQALSGTVASASEQASANVQSVASATEEMTSSVNEIARQVQESSKIAAQAVQQAEKTDARIGELSQAAGRIGDVVKLITAIAEQTNLLALNATIEAARAGEAGRGFAVVASEVKQLASQTAKATEEIGTQIAGMQNATQDSVAAIKEIGGTIGRIAEIASMISATVEEQGAATQEIARNVGEAAKGTALVASNISDVNRGASETGSASAQVLSSAQSMSSESTRLKVEVEKFLSTVRAA
jgi:methyl-accepting chemotaxis protein